MQDLSKYFKSRQGWFELTYPEHWTQFEEDDGTYLFLDNEHWKGNLRITPMRFEGVNKVEHYEKVEIELKSELEKRNGSRIISIKDKKAVYWTKEVNEDDEVLLIYNWTIGYRETVLLCSFAINKAGQESSEIKKELSFVIETLGSIKFYE